MKFEEVLPALREGKKIRKIGSRNYYCLEYGRIREYSGVESMCALFGDVCLLSDWEIVEEPKKIKIKLRDLTEEQYKQWFKDNCNIKCHSCIFNNVYCVYNANCCWVKTKDLYSDKFLDQEVEIYE